MTWTQPSNSNNSPTMKRKRHRNVSLTLVIVEERNCRSEGSSHDSVDRLGLTNHQFETDKKLIHQKILMTIVNPQVKAGKVQAKQTPLFSSFYNDVGVA